MKANIVHVWQDSSNKKMCVNFLGKRQCGFPRRGGRQPMAKEGCKLEYGVEDILASY